VTHWIEFESKSHLWRGVRYSTNIAGFPSLVLEHKRGELSTLSNGDCIARAQASDELKMGGRLFKPTRTEQKLWLLRSLTGLVCGDFSLRFDRLDQNNAGDTGVRITAGHLPQEQYIVTNKISPFLIRTKTRVRIESKAPPQDLHLMIACLTYFWNYFETDRTYD
jgi:hypothetical protein